MPFGMASKHVLFTRDDAPSPSAKLTREQPEGCLWSAADILRGSIDTSVMRTCMAFTIAFLPASCGRSPLDVRSFADGGWSKIAGSGPDSALDSAVNPACTFAPPQTWAAGVQPQSLAVGDFNRDGHPDLAVENARDGTVGVFLSQCQ